MTGVAARHRRAERPGLRLQSSTDHAGERRSTWTELFFDLVFVVAVAQLAAGLHRDPTIAVAGAFLGLFDARFKPRAPALPRLAAGGA